MLRILSLGGSISVLWENCSGEAGGGVRLYTVCNKEGRTSEHQRLLLSSEENQISSQVKEFSVLLCAARWSLRVHCVHCFHMHLTYLGPNPVCCHLKGWQGWWLAALAWHPLPSSSSPVTGHWHLLDHRPCVHFGEPSFTFGGHESLIAVIFFVLRYGKKYFISQN